MLIGLWVGGMLAGAASTLSIIREMFFGFAVPASLIYLSYVVMNLQENQAALGLSFLIFIGLIINIAIRTTGEFAESIRLKLQNQKLQIVLKEEAEFLEKKEEEIMTQRRREATLQYQKAHADEKLQAADENRLLLLDAVQEGIYGINNIGPITFINASALEILKFEEKDVLGRSAKQLINRVDESLPTETEANKSISLLHKKGESIEAVESIFFGKEDIQIHVRFSCKPIIKHDEVIGAVVSFVDITRQREMESMLIHSQKMEAIGRLTGGVSHDFNNLLTVIMGNLQFLGRRLENDEKSSNLLNKVMTAAKNGAELNNRLLSFSRNQTLETSAVDINEMLQEMYEFLDRVLGEEIELKLDVSDQEWVVNTDRTQLENAILNLCANARDAMPEGGKLSISTQVRQLADSYLGKQGDAIGDYLQISVTDTGKGIPREIREQIFEPFFTTKSKNKGTGLGLATVYTFLKQSGGNITVSSKEGQWTTFRLFLPLSVEASEHKPAIKQHAYSSEQFQGKVLVVEDDVDVRDVASQTLAEAGFEVIVAGDGHDGLQKFKDNPDIDLVFSDVVMPGGMSGIDLAREVLALSPSMPILLTTGYTEEKIKQGIMALDNIEFVPKPYDTNELPKFVNSLMVNSPLH